MNLNLFNYFQFIAFTFIEIQKVLLLNPESFYKTLVVLIVSFLTNIQMYEAHLIYTLPQTWNQPFFQEVLASFCGKGYFRTTIWLLGVFLGLFSIVNIYRDEKLTISYWRICCKFRTLLLLRQSERLHLLSSTLIVLVLTQTVMESEYPVFAHLLYPHHRQHSLRIPTPI